MVPFYTSKIGNTIDRGGGDGDRIFSRLALRGYLSWKGLFNKAAVVDVIDRSLAEWRGRPFIPRGEEWWPLVYRELNERRFLSWWAYSWGMRNARRRWQ